MARIPLDPASPKLHGRELAPPLSDYEKKKQNRVPVEMKNGMRALLNLHNEEEMRILVGQLGMHDKRSKATRIQKIFQLHLQQGEKSYTNLLSLIWEGIIIEYLRTVGRTIRSYTQDPRSFVMKYWKRGQEVEKKIDTIYDRNTCKFLD